MFEKCSKLAKVPELPATELTELCYEGMFFDCSTITKAPRLPATTLPAGCYNYMFSNCSNLNYIEVAFTQWPDEDTTLEWMSNVAANGTFVCPTALADIRGINNIPEKWTKTNAAGAKSRAKSQFARSTKTAKAHNGIDRKLPKKNITTKLTKFVSHKLASPIHNII